LLTASESGTVTGLCQGCLAKGVTALGAPVDYKVLMWAAGGGDDLNEWLLCTPCHAVETAEEARQRVAGGVVARLGRGGVNL